MKIKKLIAIHDRVDKAIKMLLKHIPKNTDIIIKNEVSLSPEEALEIYQCLIWLEVLLDNTINSVTVKELWNIDDCFK